MDVLDDLYTYAVNSLATSVYTVVRRRCANIGLYDVLAIVEEPARRDYGDLSLPLYRLSRMCGFSLNELGIALN